MYRMEGNADAAVTASAVRAGLWSTTTTSVGSVDPAPRELRHRASALGRSRVVIATERGTKTGLELFRVSGVVIETDFLIFVTVGQRAVLRNSPRTAARRESLKKNAAAFSNTLGDLLARRAARTCATAAVTSPSATRR
jgi:hypothetical protein